MKLEKIRRRLVFLTIFTVLFSGNQTVIGDKSQILEKQHNRLIHEKSPYLLQHAHNPVEWYPWGEEAFERAKKEDKLIFLSIGYSTCHWCHVMERESFSDPNVAKLMNEVFVSIKVDKEERPDVDKVYMAVCQMMLGRCGWPLNVIITPDKKPLFIDTYMSKEDRFGMEGMLSMIARVKELWSSRHDELISSASRVAAALQHKSNTCPGKEPDEVTLRSAYKQLAQRFDKQYGGFRTAPKFPTPHNLLFLLRYWKRTGDGRALEMVEKTLQGMQRGGIYDHIGYGFHRYSTDSRWLVPHFEKMLYDQAMLAMAYTEAYQATRKKEYGETAQEIFTYVLRDMKAPKGGFYSAEDADSEGEEGKFYLWRQEEIRQILAEKEADLIIKVFNINKEGNFAETLPQRTNNANILHRTKSLKELASKLNVSEQDLRKRIEKARQKLFAVRKERVHPYKDDKVLTDWNGLMIAAMAKGAQVFDEPKYAQVAKKAADFILKNMYRPNTGLLHRYRDYHAAIPAYLDDYAFFIWGLLELYEAQFDVAYLQASLKLSGDLIKHFWDDKNGGFYFTADNVEDLILRDKEAYDGAIPSGNSVAMLNLLRLGRMTANPDLEKKHR